MLSDKALLEGFEQGTLAKDAFHHVEHVRTAWLFVRRHGMPAALAEYSTALKRFAIEKGAPHDRPADPRSRQRNSQARNRQERNSHDRSSQNRGSRRTMAGPP